MRIIILLVLIAGTTSLADAQNRRRSKTPLKPATPTVLPAASPGAEVSPAAAKPEPKKNERPAQSSAAGRTDSKTQSNHFPYRYEFAQPEFEISKIVIEHDEAGRGTITFTKRMFNDSATDPVQISPAVLERINAAYNALNFIDSNESYQHEKDFSHLGVSTFRLKRNGKERTASFSYTPNKDAKTVADEYRKIGNQFIWIFDIGVARENQPLEAPRLLDALEMMIRRNEIADAQQMVPLLNSLADDERIPLIARNHARKLGEKIGKGKK